MFEGTWVRELGGKLGMNIVQKWRFGDFRIGTNGVNAVTPLAKTSRVQKGTPNGTTYFK